MEYHRHLDGEEKEMFGNIDEETIKINRRDAHNNKAYQKRKIPLEWKSKNMTAFKKDGKAINTTGDNSKSMLIET